MTDMQVAQEILERLQNRNPRFHEPRHISGEELAHGVRDLALDQYGPMARTVLGHWGIHGTEDLGEIVFAMVECGVLVKQEEDRKEDFQGLFDFEEAFEREYPWGRRF
jgi:uncharacterized repeat protein (TIGR04138 family)